MRAGRRRGLVPEVVQTSGMDCGPASLTCLLEGFGVPASYGRIREACQTEVDGTSIDTLEEVLIDLGFDARQMMVPTEHVLLRRPGLLPAIAITAEADGVPHFVVVWRVAGPLVQVMDPAVGRRWMSRAAFLRTLYRHTMPVPLASWRAWADSAAFAEALRARLGAVGVGRATAEEWIASARADPGWRSLGALDAAARMAETVVGSGAVGRGATAARLAGALFARARQPAGASAIPARFWTVQPQPGGDGDGVLVTGAVLVPVTRPPERAAAPAARLSPELAAALDQPPSRPWRKLAGLIWGEARGASLALAGFIAAASLLTIVEALVLRALIDVGHELASARMRVLAVGVVALFVGGHVAVEAATLAISHALGRRVETAVRLTFLRKMARLGIHYFRSRPSADMAERVHSLRRLRAVSGMGVDILASATAIAATTAGIVFIDPRALAPVLLVAAVALVLPLAMGSPLRERELRMRTHGGALSQLNLDALGGLMPIRAHGAERAVRGVHEELLCEWRRAARGLMRGTLASEALGALAFTGMVAWLLADYLRPGVDRKGLLLVLYWALSLGALGHRFAVAVRRYPVLRNVTLRLFELFGAADERAAPEAEHAPAAREAVPAARAAAIRIDGVTVRAGGHTILRDIDLTIEPGAHVAVVGLSGAGKSSLVGLLLGLHRAHRGSVLVDGRALDPQALGDVRRQIAWVDPAVRVWNRSLLANVLYGTGAGRPPDVGPLVEAAGLRAVLDRLPDGMQSMLGEGGALVSGGEGQCVRVARALARPDARLVLLDEPFRGLDAPKRRDLLAGARAWWSHATLLCVTHDIGETLAFSRVLVIDGGRVVEDGAPAALAADCSSRYRAMLDEEQALRRATWGGPAWRRLRMEHGRLEVAP